MKGTHKINIEELYKQGFWINPAYGGLFIEDTQTGTTFYFNQETGNVTKSHKPTNRRLNPRQLPRRHHRITPLFYQTHRYQGSLLLSVSGPKLDQVYGVYVCSGMT